MDSSKISLKEGFDFLFEEDKESKNVDKRKKFNIVYKKEDVTPNSIEDHIAYILTTDIVISAVNGEEEPLLFRIYNDPKSLQDISFVQGKTINFGLLAKSVPNVNSFKKLFNVNKDNLRDLTAINKISYQYRMSLAALQNAGATRMMLENKKNVIKISKQRYAMMFRTIKNSSTFLPKTKSQTKIDFTKIFFTVSDRIASKELLKTKSEGGKFEIDESWKELNNHEKTYLVVYNFFKGLSKDQISPFGGKSNINDFLTNLKSNGDKNAVNPISIEDLVEQFKVLWYQTKSRKPRVKKVAKYLEKNFDEMIAKALKAESPEEAKAIVQDTSDVLDDDFFDKLDDTLDSIDSIHFNSDEIDKIVQAASEKIDSLDIKDEEARDNVEDIIKDIQKIKDRPSEKDLQQTIKDLNSKISEKDQIDNEEISKALNDNPIEMIKTVVDNSLDSLEDSDSKDSDSNTVALGDVFGEIRNRVRFNTELDTPETYDEFMRHVIVFDTVFKLFDLNMSILKASSNLSQEKKLTTEKLVKNYFEVRLTGFNSKSNENNIETANFLNSIQNLKEFKNVEGLMLEENKIEETFFIKITPSEIDKNSTEILNHLFDKYLFEKIEAIDILSECKEICFDKSIYPTYELIDSNDNVSLTSIDQATTILSQEENISVEKAEKTGTLNLNVNDETIAELDIIAQTISLPNPVEDNANCHKSLNNSAFENVTNKLSEISEENSNVISDVKEDANTEIAAIAEELKTSPEEIATFARRRPAIILDASPLEKSGKDNEYLSILPPEVEGTPTPPYPKKADYFVTYESFKESVIKEISPIYPNIEDIFSEESNNEELTKIQKDLKVFFVAGYFRDERLDERILEQIKFQIKQNCKINMELIQKNILDSLNSNLIGEYIENKSEFNKITKDYGDDAVEVLKGMLSQAILDGINKSFTSYKSGSVTSESLHEGFFKDLFQGVKSAAAWIPKLGGGLALMTGVKMSIAAIGGAALIAPLLTTIGGLSVISAFKDIKKFNKEKEKYQSNPKKYFREVLFNNNIVVNIIEELTLSACAKQIELKSSGERNITREFMIDDGKVIALTDARLDAYNNFTPLARYNLRQINRIFLNRLIQTKLYKEGIINENTINSVFNNIFLQYNTETGTLINIVPEQHIQDVHRLMTGSKKEGFDNTIKEIMQMIPSAISRTSFKTNFIDWTENEVRKESSFKGSTSRFKLDVERRKELKDSSGRFGGMFSRNKQLWISPEQIEKDFTDHLFAKSFGVFRSSAEKNFNIDEAKSNGLYYNPSAIISGNLSSVLFENVNFSTKEFIFENEESFEENIESEEIFEEVPSQDLQNDVVSYANTLHLITNPVLQLGLGNEVVKDLTGTGAESIISKVFDVLFPKASAEDIDFEVPNREKAIKVQKALESSENIPKDKAEAISKIADKDSIKNAVDTYAKSESTPAASKLAAKFGYVNSPEEALKYQKMHIDPIHKNILFEEGGRQKIIQFFFSSSKSLHGKSKALGAVKIDLEKGTSEFLGKGEYFQENFTKGPGGAYMKKLGIVFDKEGMPSSTGKASELSPDDSKVIKGFDIVLKSLKGSAKSVMKTSETAMKKLGLKAMLKSDAEFSANALGKESNFKSFGKFAYKQWAQQKMVGKAIGKDISVDGPLDVLELTFKNAEARLENIPNAKTGIMKFLSDTDIVKVHKEIITLNKQIADIGMDSPGDIGIPQDSGFFSMFKFNIDLPGMTEDDIFSASKEEIAEADALIAKQKLLLTKWEDAIAKGFDKHLGDLSKPAMKTVMKTVVQSFTGTAKSQGYNPGYKKLVDSIAEDTGESNDNIVNNISKAKSEEVVNPENTKVVETKAVETSDEVDLEINSEEIDNFNKGLEDSYNDKVAKVSKEISQENNISEKDAKTLAKVIVKKSINDKKSEFLDKAKPSDDNAVKSFDNLAKEVEKTGKEVEAGLEKARKVSKKIDKIIKDKIEEYKKEDGDSDSITQKAASAAAKSAPKELTFIQKKLGVDLSDPNKIVDTSYASYAAAAGILGKIAAKFWTRGIKGGAFAEQFVNITKPEETFGKICIAALTMDNFEEVFEKFLQQAGSAVNSFEKGVNPSDIIYKFQQEISNDEIEPTIETLETASELEKSDVSESFVYNTSLKSFLIDNVNKNKLSKKNLKENTFNKEIDNHKSLLKDYKNFFNI